jgi:hypothetical protein
VISSQSQVSLTQRSGLALTEALRQERAGDVPAADDRIRGIGDLLIEGIVSEQLPDSIQRTRLRSPDCAAALAVNSFLPWRDAIEKLPLAGWTGFDAAQFDALCPTGLRGTPPHLDLLALRVEVAVAVTVRCIEYLSRRKTSVAPSYDRLLAATPGLDAWRQQLGRLRDEPRRYRHVDLGALIKFAVALGRTFPERPTVLLYLFWEPLDADRFEEFLRHRHELAELQQAVGNGRVTFSAQSFLAMWRDWAERDAPAWLSDHVDRLRARYCVAIAGRG